MDELQILKTSQEWYSEYEDIEIIDPLGWLMENLDFSFNEELISKEEFEKRLNNSIIFQFSDKNTVLKKASKKYGTFKQLMTTQEELSELIRAISRYLAERDVDETEIIDEIADSVIMIEQVVYMFGLKDRVRERIKYKLKRVEKKIELEENDQIFNF